MTVNIGFSVLLGEFLEIFALQRYLKNYKTRRLAHMSSSILQTQAFLNKKIAARGFFVLKNDWGCRFFDKSLFGGANLALFSCQARVQFLNNLGGQGTSDTMLTSDCAAQIGHPLTRRGTSHSAVAAVAAGCVVAAAAAAVATPAEATAAADADATVTATGYW